jgi:hypothetical protein
MTINWQKLHRPGAVTPYEGRQVLVAVAHRVGDAWGGDGLKLDEDFPYTIYLARWDDEAGMWATTEADEESGGVLWLSPEQTTFWAQLDMPGQGHEAG